MLCYTAVIRPEGPSSFGVTFPDLPGCRAGSETWAGVPEAAKQAMETWFASRPHVEPSALAALLDRDDIAESVAMGALLLPVFYARRSFGQASGAVTTPVAGADHRAG
ncbi:type II toxin-antitoxin system HicB family antitoxin [Paragemmobacter straminiformis]|uniref:Type II toxin-antitoxin system HicB family antitoxin n=1 Tax=Paragemmobacter straminiformis TaxID=2045119 RepID=A0A842I7Q3_9RHOB|nr:type II toxin-antitoxin system HicB family antitoxin [Gemmobacter straminiformis]MBC2835655.1 type II toxin-antitoxin system HicB family antitoxin [Gemmobacter straminiformis]